MPEMVGGPDSVPDFLKDPQPEVPPELIEEPMVGGPDSLPDFLKPELIEEPLPELIEEPVPEPVNSNEDYQGEFDSLPDYIKADILADEKAAIEADI